MKNPARFLLPLVGLLLLSCAPIARPTAPEEAILEVANRSAQVQEIFLDGQRIGSVSSGARRRFVALPVRSYHLSAAPLTDGEREQQAWDAVAQPYLIWTLAVDAPATPEPPGLGNLQLTNALGRDLSVFVDGIEVASLFADSHREIRDIPAGSHVVEARLHRGERRFRKRLDVGPGAVTPWTISAPMGSLTVHNSWDERVRVTLDGEPLGVVPPRQQRSFSRIFDGVASLAAVGLVTRTAAQAQLEVRAGRDTPWRLSTSGGTLTIDNRADEPLAVAVDGRARGLVAPLETTTIDGLRPGSRLVRVVGAETGLTLDREIVLSSGARATWSVDPRFAVVSVENASPEPQLLFLDSHPAGRVRPGERLTLSDVSTGDHELAAVGQSSNTRTRTRVHARPEAPASWTVRGVSGALVVRNERPESVRLYLDARALGTLTAGQTARFADLSCGQRVLEAYGLDSRRTIRTRVSLSRDDEASWLITDPRGKFRLTNDSGEALVPGPEFGPRPARILSGRSHEFSLPEGTRKLSCLGADSGFLYATEVRVVPGAGTTWRVPPPHGGLLLHNRAGEALKISLDGVPLRELPPGEDLFLPDLPAGTHQVTALGILSRAPRTRRLALAPGKRLSWEIRPRFARLRVWNRSQEAQSLYVDGAASARVDSDGIVELSQLAPGRHTLESRGERSGLRRRLTLSLSAAHLPVWEIRSSRSGLLVEGREGESFAVLVDGAPSGEAGGPGEPATLQVPAGDHTVAALPSQGDARMRTRLRFAPERTYELAIPGAERELRVTNATRHELRIFLGDRLLGTVPSGATLRDVRVPQSARLSLRALSQDGLHSWSRTLRSVSDETPTTPLRWRVGEGGTPQP